MRYLGVELHSDEEVKDVVRQYTARLVSPFAVMSLLFIFAFFFFVPLWNLHLWSWNISVAGKTIFFASLSFGLFYFWRSYVIWRGTMLIITNQRIIDVERRGFFDRIVSEVPYESLSDVSYRSKGLIEMTAGIGTITFQLFSGNENVSFAHMINPAALHKQILELRVAYLRGAPVVDDPVEGMMNRAGKLSPTEQRALLAGLKKTVPARSVPGRGPKKDIELP
jgi:hypothetical protein